MRKATEKISVSFLKLGLSSRIVKTEEDSTVQNLLDTIPYVLGPTEVVYVNGERVNDADEAILEEGDDVVISTKKDAGVK